MMNSIFRKRVAIVLAFLGLLSLSAPVSGAAPFPYVSPLSWSPDGSKIAIVSGSTVEVRDAATAELLYTLNGHKDAIPMVAWSPDGTMIATPSYDQTVKVWSAVDGVLLHTLVGHNEAVTALAWSPDSRQIISSGLESEPSLFVWDSQTGDLLSTHGGGTIADMRFSPNGQRLALSTSLSLSINNATTLDVIAKSPRVACCSNQMYSLAWSPDGNRIVTGSLNGIVTLWDANTAQILKQFEANPYYKSDSRDVDNLALSWVRTVTFGPDGKSVLAASGDGTVREWDSVTGALLQDIQIAPLFTAAWSPYSGQLAVWKPIDQSAVALSEQAFDASTGVFTTVVPMPSRERLQAIVNACNMPGNVKQPLTANIAMGRFPEFISSLESLPAGTISPACTADLLAMAQVLQEP